MVLDRSVERADPPERREGPCKKRSTIQYINVYIDKDVPSPPHTPHVYVAGVYIYPPLYLPTPHTLFSPTHPLTVLLATLLRIEDWRLALLEYPSLLDDPAVRGLFELHVRGP